MNKQINKKNPLPEKQKEMKYSVLIESFINNLIAFFLEPSLYYKKFKEYISIQFKYRIQYFFIGIILFVFSLYFLFFFLAFLFFSIYIAMYQKIQKHGMVSFLLAWIIFLIFFLIVYCSLHSFSKIGKKIKIRRGDEN